MPDDQGHASACPPLTQPAAYVTPFDDLETFTSPDELEDFHATRYANGGVRAGDVTAWLRESRPVTATSSGTQLQVFPSGHVMPAEPDTLLAGAAYHDVKNLLLRARGVM